MDKNDNPVGNLINTKHFKVSYMLVGYIVAGIVVAWWIYWLIIYGWLNIGYESIGALFEKKEYTTQYWVYLRSEDDDSKNYRLKGDIDRVSGDEYDYYVLRKVYWPNDGYMYFSDCDITKITKGRVTQSCIADSESGYSYQIRLGEKVE